MADLKLKDLRYLVAVADTRHFGQAAARCFVSQPTLSAQLKKLEEYLGVQLVERQPRRIALTEAGQSVVAHARRILEASEEIITVAHALAKRKSVQPRDLDGQTLLLLEDGHCLRDQALEVCALSSAQEKHDFRATSLETLRQMVASGAGITLLPELASRGAYGTARGVTIVPFAKPVPVRHIGIVWRKTSARAKAIEAVGREITDAMHKQFKG